MGSAAYAAYQIPCGTPATIQQTERAPQHDEEKTQALEIARSQNPLSPFGAPTHPRK